MATGSNGLLTSATERLRQWPFIPPDLVNAPDPELIESLGLAALNRALNLRSSRVMAFVGAGVSMCYGRISWQELNYTMQREVLARYESLRHEIELDPSAAHILTLHKTLQQLEITRYSELPPDRLPTLFQLCDRLDQALADWQAAHQPSRLQPLRFRDRVISLTQDDSGHAWHILMDALKDASKIDSKNDRHADRFHDTYLGRWRTVRAAFFTAAALSKLSITIREQLVSSPDLLADQALTQPGGPVCELLSAIEGHAMRGQPEEENVGYLLPVQRYLIGVLLRMLPIRQRQVRLNELLRHAKPSERLRPAPARYHFVPKERDPLAMLYEDFEISRFLTTNYDGEIEQMLQDRGLAIPRGGPGDGLARHADPMRRMARTIVFYNHSAGDLVAFAVQEGTSATGVVHLHGKAEADGEIIATEGDYQKRYMRRDETRPLVDEAIGLAFAANPILFVGSGMGEDDILRPLRHFMSSPSQRGERVAVAFLPALAPWNKIDQQQLTLLERYGIHAVYYGWARMKGDSARRERRAEKTHVMWLPHVWAIKRKLEELCSDAESSDRFFTMLTDARERARFRSTVDIINREIDKALDGLAAIRRGRGGESYALQDERGIPADGILTERERRRLLPPTEIEGLDVTGNAALSVDLEVNLINSAIAFAAWLNREELHTKIQELPLANKEEAAGDPWCASLRRTFKAYTAALAGAGDGIISAFLCARLQRAYRESQKWNESWFKIPEPRPTQQQAEQPDKDDSRLLSECQLVKRHVVELARLHKPKGAERNGYKRSGPSASSLKSLRFYSDAPSQAFNSLISALGTVSDSIKRSRGQRLFLLIARRGVGKGHFFSSLSSSKHLVRLFKVIGPRRALWVRAAFFNLAFSHEVGSVLDRIAQLLYDFLLQLTDGDGQEYQRDWQQLQNDRLGRLQFVTSALRRVCADRRERADERERRVLIAINAFNILFDSRGEPKNEQIGLWLDALLDIRQQAQERLLPIDLVLICVDGAIPHYFRGDEKHPAAVPLLLANRIDISERGRRAVEERWRALKLFPAVDRAATAAAAGDGALAVAHFLHGARASLLASAFFPEAALAIACSILEEEDRRNEAEGAARTPRKWTDVDFGNMKATGRHVMELIEVVSDLRATKLDRAGNKATHIAKSLVHVNELIPAILAAEVLEINAEHRHSEVPEGIREVIDCVTSREGLLGDVAVGVQEAYRLDAARRWEDFARDAGKIDQRMKEIFESVGSGRFAFTLLLATLSEIVTVERDHHEVAKFVAEIRHDAKAVADPLRCDFVIGKVLRKLKERHSMNRLPTGLYQPLRSRGKELFELQDAVLWHLAVIGQPVEADVLARCPLIRRAVDAVIKVSPGNGKPADGDSRTAQRKALRRRTLHYEETINRVLEMMVHRCLVHQLGPLPRFFTADRGGCRFALHRLVQRHVLQRIGASFIEYPEADDLAPTLYASQPKTLPRLSADDHDNLKETVAALSGYPNGNGLAEIFSEPSTEFELSTELREKQELYARETGQNPQSEQGKELRSQIGTLKRDFLLDLQKRMLRAALGIVRSVYSVPAIARLDFAAQPSDQRASFDEGFLKVSVLEDHRQQVRWLLRQAVEVGRTRLRDGDKSGACNGKEHDGPRPPRLEHTHAPFYREEIVSLYNECDLFGLLAGRVSDAAEPFERALAAVRRIEPNVSGPLHKRILLNAAIRDIERGRLGAAEATLLRINASERRPTADNGNPDPTLQGLDATDVTQELCSKLWLIATGYLGLVAHLSGDSPRAHDLYKIAYSGLRLRGDTRAASIFARHWSDLYRGEGQERRAEHYVEVALNLSRDCGHEDIRHLALISQAKLKLASKQLDDHRAIHLQLNAVDRYARVIGMPRLECEVARIRAMLHEKSGDFTMAGTLATRGLEIAAQCDLRIRKIRLLELLAHINCSRGQYGAAVPILEEAMDLTRACGWNLGLSQAQKQMNEIIGGQLRMVNRPNG